MKKYLILLFLAFNLFLVNSFALTIPSPKDFNDSLKKRKLPLTYYYNYLKEYPLSMIVLKDVKSGRITYFVTMGEKIFVDTRSYRISSVGDYSLYSFYYNSDGELSPSGGFSRYFSLSTFEVLFVHNGFDLDGNPLDSKGNPGGVNVPGSWSPEIEQNIPNVPDYPFDKENENPNNSFFGSIVSYFKSFLSMFSDLFGFIVKAFNKMILSITDLFNLLKGFVKFVMDFLTHENYIKWLTKIFNTILFLEPDYIKNNIEQLKELLNKKINVDNYSLLFSNIVKLEPVPFEDVKLTFRSFGSNMEVIVVSADTLNSSVSYFKPIITWFLNFFLGLYHFNQIYFLIRGVKYFSVGKGSNATDD